jgi:hypothetical protein
MLFNEMQSEVYYEMKKEEMEKVILANKFSKSSEKESFFKKFFKVLMDTKTQKKYLNAKQYCCEN